MSLRRASSLADQKRRVVLVVSYWRRAKCKQSGNGNTIWPRVRSAYQEKQVRRWSGNSLDGQLPETTRTLFNIKEEEVNTFSKDFEENICGGGKYLQILDDETLERLGCLQVYFGFCQRELGPMFSRPRFFYRKPNLNAAPLKIKYSFKRRIPQYWQFGYKNVGWCQEGHQDSKKPADRTQYIPRYLHTRHPPVPFLLVPLWTSPSTFA